MMSWRRFAIVACVVAVGLSARQPVPARAGLPENPGTTIPTPNIEPPAPTSVLLPSAGANNANGFPTKSSQPQSWKVGDAGAEYQVSSTGTTTIGAMAVADGDRGNVSISADARLVVDDSTAADAILRLGCRFQNSSSGFTGYAFSFSPSGNTWSLDRFDSGVDSTLTGVQFLTGAAAFLYDKHHLQLTCSGNTLSAGIDGRNVGSVSDGAYPDGQAMVGVGMFTRDQSFFPPLPAGSVYPGTLDARFGNLALTQP